MVKLDDFVIRALNSCFRELRDFTSVKQFLEHISQKNNDLRYGTKLSFFDVIKRCRDDQMRGEMFDIVNERLLQRLSAEKLAQNKREKETVIEFENKRKRSKVIFSDKIPEPRAKRKGKDVVKGNTKINILKDPFLTIDNEDLLPTEPKGKKEKRRERERIRKQERAVRRGKVKK